ncbi:MAG: hypothetical protein RMY28_023540 [Nostoc sp. ChiSLP01]
MTKDKRQITNYKKKTNLTRNICTYLMFLLWSDRHQRCSTNPHSHSSDRREILKQKRPTNQPIAGKQEQ